MAKQTTPQDKARKSTPLTFHTTILQNDKNAAGIEVPEELIEKLGSSKRPLVPVTIRDDRSQITSQASPTWGLRKRKPLGTLLRLETKYLPRWTNETKPEE